VFRLLAEGHKVFPISFIYGQKHVREINAAKAIAQALGLKHEVVNLKHLQPLFAASALTNPDQAIPQGHYADESMKATVVPNRNMVLLSLATAWALPGSRSLSFSARWKSNWSNQTSGRHYPSCRWRRWSCPYPDS
jgi:7-cyano-7-deazaguanine synthase